MYSPSKEDEYLLSLHNSPGTFVDLGASDGTSWSNSRLLAENGWGGLCVECDPIKLVPLHALHANRPCVKICGGMACAENIGAALDEAGIPESFQVLSIDIDGMDAYVMEAILKKRTPSTIIVEINQYVPPPWRFCLDYNKDWVWGVNPQFGASLEHYCDMLTPRGYGLHRLFLNNAIFRHGADCNEASTLWDSQLVPDAIALNGRESFPTQWAHTEDGIRSILGNGPYSLSLNPITVGTEREI